METRFVFFEILFAMILWLGAVLGTVELNLPELQYVADHLTKSECRKLVAVLHDPNFDIVNNIYAAEHKVPDDIPCLKLLIHWNSQPGEGKGETHVVLAHRLKQLGHDNLADWLSRTVFHQLGLDLNRTLLMDPFKDVAQEDGTEESVEEILTPMGEEDEDEWLPIDTMLCIILVIFVFVIISFVAEVAWLYFKKQRRETIEEDQTSWKPA